MLEPSFYYGAMYVSYGITVAMAIVVFLLLYVWKVSLIWTLLGIVLTLLLSNPFVMRFSRLLYINFFVHFDKKARQKAEVQRS